jgi:hypothetical protein
MMNRGGAMHTTVAFDIVREETRRRQGRAERLAPHLSALKACCARLLSFRSWSRSCRAAA